MFEHIWKPGNSNRVLVLFHGTGGDEESLLPLAQSISPEYSVLSLRGRVDEGGQLRFFRRFAEGLFDEESILRESQAIADFLADMAAKHGFDRSRAIALGFSNGANIAASVLLLHPEALGGGILLRPMVPLRPAHAPGLPGKRILAISGDSDPIVPIQNAKELAAMFRGYGAEVDHVELKAGHNLTRAEIEIAKSWLEQIK